MPSRVLVAVSAKIMALLQFLFLALLSIALAVDRMPLGSRLLATESLISTNGTVKLEFFSLTSGSSSDLYLGISFNTRTSEFIPIWIANRDDPVSSNASLLLTSEGELQIIDRGSIIWSGAPSSRNSGTTQAVLLDSGNFVLTDDSFDPSDDNATYPWQSFDHPADAWVPRMKMFLGDNLTAWKSSVSPASGRFVMTMRTSTEFVISTTNDTSREYWTSGAWNGRIFSLVPQMTDNYLYTFIFNATNPPYFTWFEKSFQHSIFRLGHDGRIEVKQLDGNGNWYTPWVVPANICGVTSLCGSNSVCSSNSNPPCSCPTGSSPSNGTNWRTEDWAEGCTALSSQARRSSSKISGVAVGVGAGAGVLLLLLAGVAAFVIVRRRRKAKRVSSGRGSSDGSGYNFVSGELAHFTFKQLHAATDGFRKQLGSGGFGEVFKGSIQGEAVAVKRLMRFDDKQFRAEVSTIGTIQHMNLVRLRGFCADGALQRLLVYEFVERGSLDRSLFNRDAENSIVLSWTQRFGIALGTAKGLAYLHEECRDRIIHCDIKPENILLDAEMKPKVGDFGLAKLMGREFSRVVTSMRGTRGYLAPEWLSNMPITPKADVYSYGMTLLEIISGRRNVNVQSKQPFYPFWAAQQVRNGEFAKLPDDRLEEWDEDELRRAAKTALWCVQDDEINRPSMKTVVQMLEGSATDFPDPVIPSSFEIWLEIEEESG
ncbi:G-type lectin S-receptor-like serine/threonine-protein kinase SD2-2 [Selaginella moellendorffii]|nr:G-type lectin S-receptor-like serine/threonine-protein kinase SD2-2 [Selaginella moellendorffii]|eukprot:XP_002965980.2 G-type lectin S-receptor-like serine/threonine-protein kinase SD2-2 [Selaginella moellendorffii]